jgi:hypothetical protein
MFIDLAQNDGCAAYSTHKNVSHINYIKVKCFTFGHIALCAEKGKSEVSRRGKGK